MTAALPRPESQARGFLRHLNPLAKLAATMPVVVLLVFTDQATLPLIFTLIALLLLAVGGGLNGRLGLFVFVGLPAAALLMTLGFALWVDPAKVADSATLLSIGPWTLHVGALAVGGTTALRVLSILALSLVGGMTSTGPDVVRAMVQQLRVPYRIGYTALAAFRFVPRFGSELETIRKAHRVRGMAGGPGPIAAVQRNVGYAVPLLASAIRHAERVALSMDARAFGAHPTRTERYEVPFRARDTVFLLLFWALTAALFLTVPLGSAQ
ncbi:energy-coupling factor transporter transmembrane protein EcfT [Microbacteriaceae bacterium VKM Ac-2854]|nr:energy-coupling factor transporter transmembrane protein EcfT [Microbacteriaceae bacterium VKM Ac-2854]